MRIAKSVGNVSVLLPPGCTSFYDVPHQLFEAIQFGLTVVSWEELPKEERPPREIWLQPDKLTAHFEDVERQRKAKYGSEDREAIEDPVENEAAKLLIHG